MPMIARFHFKNAAHLEMFIVPSPPVIFISRLMAPVERVNQHDVFALNVNYDTE